MKKHHLHKSWGTSAKQWFTSKKKPLMHVGPGPCTISGPFRVNQPQSFLQIKLLFSLKYITKVTNSKVVWNFTGESHPKPSGRPQHFAWAPKSRSSRCSFVSRRRRRRCRPMPRRYQCDKINADYIQYINIYKYDDVLCLTITYKNPFPYDRLYLSYVYIQIVDV